MPLSKWIGKKKRGRDDEPIGDYTLSKLRPGFLVDFDLQTWQVTAIKTYDYEGEKAIEWELRAAGGEVRFLERSEADGRVEMSLTKSISIRDFEEDVMGTILEEEDPPEIVTRSGREYAAIEASTGTQAAVDDEQEETDKDAACDPPGRPFVSWTYASKEGRVVYVVRWGDRDFSAYEGEYVEEYQFTDILPATLS